MSKGKAPAPPEITNGSFVAWKGGKGRVDLLVSNGKVPGVEDDVEGTAKSPAARVVVWEDGKATRKKIGVSTHTLRRIPPIKDTKSADPGAALVEILADHEEYVEDAGLPAVCRVSSRAVKAAYQRGLDGWPGPAVTTLSQQQWAVGRAEHFAKVAVLAEDRVGNDTDLLDPEHPAAAASDPLPVEALGDITGTLFDPNATAPATTEPAAAGEETLLDAADAPPAAEGDAPVLTPEQVQEDLARLMDGLD